MWSLGSSLGIDTRVAAARAMQRERAGAADSTWLNSEVEVDRIALQPEARDYAEKAAERLGLSARGFTRMLRVSRSIADLAGVPVVRRIDVAEAFAYRHRAPGQPTLRPRNAQGAAAD